MCACVKNFRFRFRFSMCRVKNEPTTTLTFDKAQKYKKKRTKEEPRFLNLGIFFFKKLGALVYVQRIIYTERIVVQEGLDRNERFS